MAAPLSPGEAGGARRGQKLWLRALPMERQCLLGANTGARANRARLHKGRASGRADTSSHHLREKTKPREAVPEQT